MSMPISSEFVATIARSAPDFSRCSTSVRISRASDPWCAYASGVASVELIVSVIFSARRRLLVKNNVAAFAAMISLKVCVSGSQIFAPASSAART